MNNTELEAAEKIVTKVGELIKARGRGQLELVKDLSLGDLEVSYIPAHEHRREDIAGGENVIIVETRQEDGHLPVFVVAVNGKFRNPEIIAFDRGSWENLLLETYLPEALRRPRRVKMNFGPSFPFAAAASG